MSIAVDQTRLRRIFEKLLPDQELDTTEVELALQFLQLAAGADERHDPQERAMLESISQHLGALAGIHPQNVLPISPIDDADVRERWLRKLGANLQAPGLRALTYALTFLVSVGDLELSDSERTLLEEMQRALGLDDRAATEIVVVLTEIVAA